MVSSLYWFTYWLIVCMYACIHTYIGVTGLGLLEATPQVKSHLWWGCITGTIVSSMNFSPERSSHVLTVAFGKISSTTTIPFLTSGLGALSFIFVHCEVAPWTDEKNSSFAHIHSTAVMWKCSHPISSCHVKSTKTTASHPQFGLTDLSVVPLSASYALIKSMDSMLHSITCRPYNLLHVQVLS